MACHPSPASLVIPHIGEGWRTQLQPIRTVTSGHTETVEYAAEITAHIKRLPSQNIPLYQKLPPKIRQLRVLGMNYPDIASN